MSKLRPVYKERLTFGTLLLMLLLTLISVVILYPMVLTALYSFFPKSEINAWLSQRNRFDDTKWMDLLFSPAEFSLRQYYTILIENGAYLQYFCNSALYMAAILAGQAFFVPLTAYCLSRFTFRGRDTLFFIILLLMILPFQVTMAPSVIILRRLNLMDTIWAVILPMWFSPFYIFLIRQFMSAMPNELLEAGMVDGVGPIRGYVHVILPACKPILCAAAALSFADSWNMVEQPLVFLAGKPNLQPLSTMFNRISTEGAEVAFAGCALYILPALLIYLLFQEDIIAGIQLSELK